MTVWRVATVQRVRTITPHAALDSLVARFRQLRPDLATLETSGIWSSGQLAITIQAHKKSNLNEYSLLLALSGWR